MVTLESSSAYESRGRRSAQLRSDAASSNDELGVHERVATSMERLIRNSEGGKTIALEGRWGSGKSSVIKMLSEKCESNGTLIHQYDAWMHVGDPLRRAFLTSLIDFLTEKGWLSNTALWRAELDMLSGKRRESEKTTSPQLTKFGLLLAISLLVFPGGLSLLAKGVEAILNQQTLHVNWWATLNFWTGLSISLLIPASWVGGAIYAKIKGTPRFDYFGAILNKQTTVERTSITEQGDQSTIEFQRVFGDVLAAALSSRGDRKLVLVIDNLDRLDAAEISNIWALLQSFVDIPQFSNRPWYQKLWVVVPIDSQAEISDGTKGRAKFEGAFLDKIFQARFRLPPPILKKWRPFLRNMMLSSLPDLGESEIEQVADLLLAKMGPVQLPTPRELVLFVNQLAVFVEQWSGQYPIYVGAAYILDNVESRFSDLASSEIPSVVAKRLSAFDLKAAYARIYFNTGDEADALELLQRPLAVQALEKRDVATISLNLSRHQSFAHILRQIMADRSDAIAEESIDVAIEELRCIIASLRDEELISLAIKDVEISTGIRQLQESLENFVYIILNREPSESLVINGSSELLEDVLSMFPSERLAQLAAQVIGNKLSPSQAKRIQESGVTAAVYRENLSRLLLNEGVRDKFLFYKREATVALTGLGFAKFLDLFDGTDEQLWQLLTPLDGVEGTNRYISSEISTGKFAGIDDLLITWSFIAKGEPAQIIFEALAGYELVETDQSIEYFDGILDKLLACLREGARPPSLKIDSVSYSASPKLVERLIANHRYHAAAKLAMVFMISWSCESEFSARDMFKHLGILAFSENPASVPALNKALKELLSDDYCAIQVFEKAVADESFRGILVQWANELAVFPAGIIIEGDASSAVINVDKLSSGGYHANKEWSLAFFDKCVRACLHTYNEDDLIDAISTSVQAWRWRTKILVASRNISVAEGLVNSIYNALEGVTSREWLEDVTNFSWRARCCIEALDNKPAFNLTSNADLVRAELELKAEKKATTVWKPELVAAFSKTIRKSASLSIGRDESDRIKSASASLGKDYWVAASPALSAWLGTPTGSSDVLPLILAIVKIPDIDGIRWFTGALVNVQSIGKSMTPKLARGELYAQIKLASGSGLADTALVGALKRLKNKVVQVTRSVGKKKS